MDRNSQGQPVSLYRGGRMSGWEGGMDNIRANSDLPSDTLRNAVNVDSLTSGKVRRRKGIVQKVASSGAHSVFAGDAQLYWATANALKSCTTNFVPVTLLTDQRLASPISYVSLNGETYFVNEQMTGKIKSTVTYEAWGVTPPAYAPLVTSLDSGTKDVYYQVTCTFVLASGEESGAPIGTTVLGAAAGAMSLTSIPQTTDARVTAIRIYVSDEDGNVFYAYDDIPVGVTSLVIQGPYGTGKKLMTQHMQPMPPGQLIEYYNGRLYVAAGNVVFFTEALRYGVYNPITNYYVFPERVTLLKAVDDGLYVSSDITYFLGGNPKFSGKSAQSPDLTPILPYKAIEGAVCDLSFTHDVMWLSERGFVIGSGGGKVKNLTEDHIAMDIASRGCMGMLEANGLRHVLAIMRESTTNPLVHDDYATAEAERLLDLA